MHAAPRAIRLSTEVGRLVLAYQTIDKEETGFWNRSTKQWEELSGGYAGSINSALRVARKVRSGQVFINNYGAGGGIDEWLVNNFYSLDAESEKGIIAAAPFSPVPGRCMPMPATSLPSGDTTGLESGPRRRVSCTMAPVDTVTA